MGGLADHLCITRGSHRAQGKMDIGLWNEQVSVDQEVI